MFRRTALALIACGAVASQAGVAPVAASSATQSTHHLAGCSTSCSTTSDGLQLTVPQGAQPCPQSGPGAACATVKASVQVAAGAPSAKSPQTADQSIRSNHVTVNWPGVTVTAKNAIAGPGKPLTLTATSTASNQSGYVLQFFDAVSNARLTYCNIGTTCSVSLISASGGSRSVVAALAKPSTTFPAPDTIAQADPVNLTWLVAAITGSSTYQLGSSINLSAVTNVDLSGTPWSLGIVDDQGHLQGQPCKTGSTCSAQVAFNSGATPNFSAVIGVVPPATTSQGKLGQLLQKVTGPTSMVDIQARSTAVKPLRMLWGVDSCKSFTDDPNAGSGLLPWVTSVLGAPDFWGRYLTNTVCPGISAAEVAAAHAKHMGILPIYNDYNCSNVAGYATGMQYAAEAVAAAKQIGIPQYRGLAIDIEPPGAACPGAANVDTGFIQGWYDGIISANYEPIFYANSTGGSEFATQWCYAVAALPEIGQRSYLWTFQPSLLGPYNYRVNAPGYSPHSTGCLGYIHGWQYQIGSDSSTPDVDNDLATSEMPLWFP